MRRLALLATALCMACGAGPAPTDHVVMEKYVVSGAGPVVGGTRYGGGVALPSNHFTLVSRDRMKCEVTEREYHTATAGKLFNCQWDEL